MLSVIIPCFNAASSIEARIGKLIAFLADHFPAFEVIIVDDGSADATPERLVALEKKDPRVYAVLLPENRGKGAAVAAGVEKSRGDFIVFTDADLPYDLEAIPRFVDSIRSGYDVILGSRYLAGTSIEGVENQTIDRTLLSRVFVFLANLALAHPVSDTQSGLKGFSRRAALAIFSRITVFRFAFDVEAIAIAQALGLRIKESPVSLVSQGRSTVRLARDGFEMCLDLLKIFLRYRLSLFK
ncbi:MAG TPA: glycosyltransferase [Candidatus Paceibacterota bacterium]|nr:glycosyltransferase [Candidatus Paceibacterota bacterium]